MKYVKHWKEEFKTFAKNIGNEAIETKNAAKIVAKHLGGEKMTEEEEKEVKEQFYDVLKAAGIGIPFIVLPGASIILSIVVIVAKKHNISLLPSSFTKKEDNT